MWRGRLVIGLLAVLPWLALPVRVQADAETESIERSLVCICGCGNMILFTCMCEDAEAMRAEIRGLMAEGKDDQAVIQVLVGRYGERVLAAPVQKGFNLTAYVIPFLAILVAAGLLVSFIRRWRREDAAPRAAGVGRPESATDSPYRQRLEDELKSFKD